MIQIKRELIRKLRTQSDCDEKIRLNELIVQIKGGRYEVNLVELTKKAIYWEEKKESFVRRFILDFFSKAIKFSNISIQLFSKDVYGFTKKIMSLNLCLMKKNILSFLK
jgi:hypothetical protein